MRLITRYYLPATVFITGACILVLEIVATRMLAPYFGNTIYTVSSVLSIVLAALSVGYYIGGRLSDKRPSRELFFGIIFVSGLLVLLLETSQTALLPMLSRYLSITTGPLVAGVLLFFMPSFMLGMLSPFAIKLAALQQKAPEERPGTESKAGIGSVAGEMFFFSTLGSIAGSLLAGFVLIPNLGTNTILVMTGLVLVVLGALPFSKKGFGGKKRSAAAIALLIAGITVSSFAPQRAGAVFSGNGLYQQLVVVDAERNNRPVRLLFQDNTLGGGMYLDSDTDLFSEYQEYYVLSEAVQGRAPRHAAIIGGGMYIAPRALLQTYPDVRVDAVEIDPLLVELSEKYFKLPRDSRLTHHITDGRRFLQDTATTYDMIFSDVYLSLYSTPMHLTTKEFFQIAHKQLTSDGVFIANIVDTVENHEHSVLRSEIRTLAQVFPHVYVFADDPLQAKGLQNFIVVGYKGGTSLQFDAPQYTTSKYPVIRALPKKAIPLDHLDSAGHMVLTDNFAPVEHWAAGMVRAAR